MTTPKRDWQGKEITEAEAPDKMITVWVMDDPSEYWPHYERDKTVMLEKVKAVFEYMIDNASDDECAEGFDQNISTKEMTLEDYESAYKLQGP